MEAVINKVVLPGATLTNIIPHRNVVILGPGLRRCRETNNLLITKSGILRHKPPNVFFVDCKKSKYIPKRGDLVVGIIARRHGDSFKVDIGSAEYASLSMFAFEGATKKQKPDVQIGDVIYARILSAHREMESDLVCVNKYFKAGNLGLLKNGFLIRIPLKFAYRLLSGKCELLNAIGKKFAFEMAIGLNGKVWINTREPLVLCKIMKVLSRANAQPSILSNARIKTLFRRL